MKTKTTILAGLFALMAIMAVSFVVASPEYTIYLDDVPKITGSTFDVDGVQFDRTNAEVFVKLDGQWYEMPTETYSYDSGADTVTLLSDTYCHGGGGCGPPAASP